MEATRFASSFAVAFMVAVGVIVSGCSGNAEPGGEGTSAKAASPQTAAGRCVVNPTAPVAAYGSVYGGVDYADWNADYGESDECVIVAELGRIGNDDDPGAFASDRRSVRSGDTGTVQVGVPCVPGYYYVRATAYDGATGAGVTEASAVVHLDCP